MKQKVKDIIWLIKAYIHQLIVSTVSMDYIIKNEGSYSANNFMKDKYVYYWVGDFKTGKEVKVKSLDVIRYMYEEKMTKIITKVAEVETHDLGETFVKNEIINILRDLQ